MSDTENQSGQVIDFVQWRTNQRKLEELSKSSDLSKLGTAELGQVLQALTKLVLTQSSLIQQMMQEINLSSQDFVILQEQCSYIAGQGFVALQMLKQKGVCTADEVSAEWQKMLEEKILKTDQEEKKDPEPEQSG